MGVITYPGNEKVTVYPGGGFIIDRIQQHSISIDHGSYTNSVAISPVDVSNAAIIWHGTYGWTNEMSSVASFVWISVPTKVQATRLGNDQGNHTMFSIVEFYKGSVKSIQRGRITISGSDTGSDTLAKAVNVNKSVVLYLGCCSITSQPSATHPTLTLTNSTTVTANTTPGTGITLIVSYEVVEFY